MLFAEGKAWLLDYPCSWDMQDYAETVHFRNDSIFFSTSNRVYIEKKQIQLKNDTLAIFGTNDYDESHYYVRKSFDNKTLLELKSKGFNEKCISGRWVLTDIGDGYSDNWVIQDGFLDHVPRELEFGSEQYIIDGKYLVNDLNRRVKFEVHQFDRYSGEESMLFVKELDKINGIEYHYTYEPVN